MASKEKKPDILTAAESSKETSSSRSSREKTAKDKSQENEKKPTESKNEAKPEGSSKKVSKWSRSPRRIKKETKSKHGDDSSKRHPKTRERTRDDTAEESTQADDNEKTVFEVVNAPSRPALSPMKVHQWTVDGKPMSPGNATKKHETSTAKDSSAKESVKSDGSEKSPKETKSKRGDDSSKRKKPERTRDEPRTGSREVSPGPKTAIEMRSDKKKKKPKVDTTVEHESPTDDSEKTVFEVVNAPSRPAISPMEVHQRTIDGKPTSPGKATKKHETITAKGTSAEEADIPDDDSDSDRAHREQVVSTYLPSAPTASATKSEDGSDKPKAAVESISLAVDNKCADATKDNSNKKDDDEPPSDRVYMYPMYTPCRCM